MYQYRIKNLNDSSAKFGPCEVCGKHVSEVHYQVESKKYWSVLKQAESWTHHNCHSLFGHDECLRGQRKE